MKFLSIKEYFYKLNTIGFILLLLPIVVFIFLYYWTVHHPPLFASHEDMIIILSVLLTLLLVELMVFHLWWGKKIKRLKNVNELAKKMEGYFTLTLLKMSVYCSCSVLISAGFFLTANSGFTAVFVVVVMATAVQWPTPASFCRHLALGKNERDMMINNLDLYRRNKRV